MQQGCSVLLVSGQGATDFALRKVLREAGVQVHSVQSCAEVRQVLRDGRVPCVLFCDASLPDGTWADILSLATRGALEIPVIVVSRVVDIKLYIDALEKGAADFIVPPFYRGDIAHVLKCATRNDVAVQKLSAA